MKKMLCIILTILFCAALLAGCGVGSAGTAAQPTVITGGSTAAATGETEKAEPTATQEPAPSPTPESGTDIPQLQAKEGYMQPGSLEGIDPLNDKVVALTFDDGPNPVKTPELLDILKENDVAATFFVIGNLVEDYPDVVKREYEEGHEIGTHSYTHPEASEWKSLSAAEQLEQYTKANDAIEAATGLRTLFDRPPGGNLTEEQAEEIGREQILWSTDPEDWKYKDTDTIYEHVMNGWNGGVVQDGAVVLSHEIYQSTVDAYARIIPELKEKGYKFVTVSQMMQIAEIRNGSLDYLFKSAQTAKEADGEE
ncbi:polysaccharide deacetylase family protein [Christensenella tenuis]|jgi:peptidoglycan-N-acetylglucosamine deacetylase|uniref:Polysaccharide deacetylase family protein n=1 Tax=Christensenella tenuis TaxID=2763033 RepID=A0ABR7EHR5_9FIRM|nr:polysaccharide deacetylase family protein [Christensenella tenuis]MBC5648688.1 polysaccharide deacetylase family protein [Christensenella tenuis]